MSKLIKTKDRVKQFGEVYTPDALIEEILNKVPKEYWTSNKNILEPSCGNGNFLVAILRKKIENKNKILDSLKVIYGIDIMKDNVNESRKRMLKESLRLGLKEDDIELAVNILKRNIIQGNALEINLEEVWT